MNTVDDEGKYKTVLESAARLEQAVDDYNKRIQKQYQEFMIPKKQVVIVK